MSATNKIDPVAEAKLRSFEHEQKVKFIINVSGYSALSLAAILLFMIVAGDTFAPVLSIFGIKGIYNEERGVYADCSKPENSNNAFCSGRRSERAEKSWNSISRSGGPATQFSLSE